VSEGAVASGALARAEAGLGRLHPGVVTDRGEIERFLRRLASERTPLHRGMNRRIDPEVARIVGVEAEGLELELRNFASGQPAAVFLNCTVDAQPYFFSAPFEREVGKGRWRVLRPAAIYRSERRDRARRLPTVGDPRRLSLEGDEGTQFEAEVADISAEGVAVWLDDTDADRLGSAFRVCDLDGAAPGTLRYGEVCNRWPAPDRKGWSRIGLGLSPTARGGTLRVENRDQVVESTARERLQRRWKTLHAATRMVADRARGAIGREIPLPSVRVIDYRNREGEHLRAIVDSWGDHRGATAVVIPPAWGRTKETMMPLAESIVSAFRAAEQPVLVVRFDGVRKRGESHNDPGCTEPGKEHHRFTFSQGIRDIQATIDHLERSPEFGPSKTIIVSFSAASIETRRAVATDSRIDGWVCVVGAADTQSMMRVISGGVDYVAGVERGVTFGIQEVLGVAVDIDHAGRDLFQNELPYLDDARRDFGKINIPVTWIHGQFDAWMDVDRARDVLSRGDTSKRKLIEVPTGHMLKTSREALETFQLVASEVSRMALGREIPTVVPDLENLDRRRRAENARQRPAPESELREFWRGYLVGTGETVGIELMTQTRAYREMMEFSVHGLAIEAEDVVLDLGCGTGALPVHLASTRVPSGVRVIGLDFVAEGFARARERLAARGSTLDVKFIESNLDLRADEQLPVLTESVDAALAGFFLSYVRRPEAVLRDLRRCLKPGGRLVVSSLRRDADVSRLFTEGLNELRLDDSSLQLGGQRVDLEAAAQSYLNQASKLLDYEESGQFAFWDLDELDELVRNAGFDVISGAPIFGHPPQAAIVVAVRR
jgi:ubiquinone/menaquinone biosynthesis C-methylase UbiE/pimeloyl-ACP methyl ester carboxylesterase